MKNLQRSKKKEMQGFKDFVKSMETTPSEKRLPKFQLCALEDPVYMSWVAKNMISIEKFFELDPEEIKLSVAAIKDPVIILSKAIGGTSYEKKLLEIMTKDDFPEKFKYELSIQGLLKEEEKELSLFAIFKAFRSLQDKDMIRGFPWRLPTIDIVKINKNIPSNGLLEQFFDENKTQKALRGELKKTQRIGSWDHYFTNGNLMAQGEYKDDEPEGRWLFFYPDGHKKTEGNYQQGKKVGIWKEWDRKGTEKNINFDNLKE